MASPSIRRIFRRWLGSPATACPPPATFMPRLLLLEERTLPSSALVTAPNQDGPSSSPAGLVSLNAQTVLFTASAASSQSGPLTLYASNGSAAGTVALAELPPSA